MFCYIIKKVNIIIDIHLTTNSASHKTEFTQNITQLLLTLHIHSTKDMTNTVNVY